MSSHSAWLWTYVWISGLFALTASHQRDWHMSGLLLCHQDWRSIFNHDNDDLMLNFNGILDSHAPCARIPWIDWPPIQPNPAKKLPSVRGNLRLTSAFSILIFWKVHRSSHYSSRNLQNMPKECAASERQTRAIFWAIASWNVQVILASTTFLFI